MGSRVSCPELVGRADELDALEAAFAGAADGRTATVLIGGDAGIGKTRLVEELCARVRDQGGLVASGACVPIDGGLPYAPVVAIIRDLVGQLDAEVTDEVLGPLAHGLGAAASGPGDQLEVYAGDRNFNEGLAKTRLFEAILAALERTSRRAPLVAVFEDLHWADSGSAELLGFLVRNLTDGRVLLIGTYRGDEVGRDHELRPWLTELARHSRVTSLLLGGLDRDDTSALIAGILGHAPDWTLVDAVWARSEGNAFFAEELTATRHESSLSPELQSVILTRVDALAAPTRRLLAVAAVAGRTTPHALLEAVTGLGRDEIDRALAEAIDRQVLVVDGRQAHYRFRHVLLREAIHGASLPAERARLHGEVGTAITADPALGPTDAGHRAAELAAHWWEAGRWAECLTASVAAADAAEAMWALPEALGHHERALAAFDHLTGDDVPAHVDRRWLLERAADAAYWADDPQRCVDLAQEAIASGDRADDPLIVARSYLLLGRNAWAIGDSGAAFDAYQRAAALVPTDPPSALRAQVLAEESRGLMLMSRFVDSEERCHEGLTTARAAQARAEEGHLLCTLGCNRASLGFADEGIGLVRQALAIAEEVGSPDAVNRAYVCLTSLLIDAGRLEESIDLLYDSAALGEGLWGIRLNGAASNCVEALIWLGRLDEAESVLAQIGRQGVGSCVASPSTSRAHIALQRGDLDEADRQLALADPLTADMADVQIRGAFLMQVAELELERGRPDEASEHVDQALALAAGTDDEIYGPEMLAMAVRCRADQLELAHAQGRPFDIDKARLLAAGFDQEARRLVGGAAERGGVGAPRPAAFLALCHAERSRLDESDPDAWATAARTWDDACDPSMAAYCRWREAEARLARRSGRARAAESLQLAWQSSVDIGTRPLTERIEDLARRARIPLREATPVEPTATETLGSDLGLTPREVEVLAQLARGRTDAEIAEALFISKKTASVHVSNLLRKLTVANRVEAGKIGQAHGLDAPR